MNLTYNMEKNINHNQWRLTHPCRQEEQHLLLLSVGRIHHPQSDIYHHIQASGVKMDIKGFGVIHPRCLSNIVEIIHTEIEQNNIDNRNLEKFVISFLLNNLINDQHLRQLEKNKHHYIREK